MKELLVLFIVILSLHAQNITHFSAYTKGSSDTRYVAATDTGQIYWFTPGYPWQKSSTQGLPQDKDIRLFSTYTKGKDTRYVVVMSDNSIYWFAPKYPWQSSSTQGLVK